MSVENQENNIDYLDKLLDKEFEEIAQTDLDILLDDTYCKTTPSVKGE